jgi:hypothetical protein
MNMQHSKLSVPEIKSGDRGWFWHPEVGPLPCQVFSRQDAKSVLICYKHPDKKINGLFQLPNARFMTT